jgi:multidrug efflux pump subunit AcrA (membrane-fusion protein)
MDAVLQQAEAALQAARASLVSARVKREFSRITAPIDGKIGRPAITPGNVVRADETVLATVLSLNPMHVAFDVDESTFLQSGAPRKT